MGKGAEEQAYGIGAVSRLVGVPVETLRSWERRYSVPHPQRSPRGRRLYSPAEVQRLRTIAALARLGDRVRDLAPLSEAALAERLAWHTGPPPRPEERPGVLRVAVVHPLWGQELGGASPTGRTRVEVVAAARAVEALGSPGPELDALILDGREWAAGLLERVEAAQALLRPQVVLLIARFLRDPVRQQLEQRGVRLVDEAVRLSSLRQQLEDAVLSARAGWARPEPLGARVSRERLQEVQAEPNGVACGCPTHLADLALRLREFEQYSRQCAVQDEAEGSLHLALAEGVAELGAGLEELLAGVLRAEGRVL